jgi:hypothetical protein
VLPDEAGRSPVSFYETHEQPTPRQQGVFMAIQIADSIIADKVDRVSKASGLSMAAVVELALDLCLSEMFESTDQLDHMADRMAQLDRMSRRAGTFESTKPMN